MRLLYTLTAYLPSIGGGQLHQHYLARHLNKHHAIQVVSQWDTNRKDWLLGTTLKAPSIPRDYKIDGIPVHRLGLSRVEKARLLPFVLMYYPLMDVALPPIARTLETHLNGYAQSADVIHNVRIGREGLSYASWQVARQYDIPFVLTPIHHPRWSGWRYRAYNRLYQLADAVIALTEAEKAILMQIGVKEERITVTGHGPVVSDDPHPDAFRAKHGISGPFVLFLGQHFRYKGYVELLEAMSQVWQDVPDAEFVFIGPAVGRSDDKFTGHTDSRVHRLGMVDLDEKTDALAACSLLCVPSMQESFGGVYTEAWTFGKPVIGGRIPSISQVITDGEDGFLVNQTPGEIAARVLDLLKNPIEAAQMGKAGNQKVRTRYSWERLAAQTEAIYYTVQYT